MIIQELFVPAVPTVTDGIMILNLVTLKMFVQLNNSIVNLLKNVKLVMMLVTVVSDLELRIV